MSITNKLVHFKTKQKFNEELTNRNILETSIVFILDTKEIYTHGLFYDGKLVDLSNIETSILNILDNYATKEEIPTKVSQLENDINYITASDIPSLDEYVTETELNDKNYLTEHQSISHLASKEELNLGLLNKQDNLTSGITIKTINGESILGSGDIMINSSSSEETVIDDGVYAVTANEKLIDYNEADDSCIGVALVAGEHKLMIAKMDATDGTNTTLYYDCDNGDLSLTNYSTADGTNRYGYLGTELSNDFTTWTEGVLSDFNGKTNTQVIAASSSNSRDMCKVLETFNAGSDNQGHNDWYIPACGQLALIYLAKTDINAALAKIGGTALESDYYWSGSEYDANNAWYVNFYNGYVGSFSKYDGLRRVRFVLDIEIKTLEERVSDLESKVKDLNTNTSNSGANVQAVDTGDVIEDVNVEYATTEYVDGLIGDINTILESIINS